MDVDPAMVGRLNEVIREVLGDDPRADEILARVVGVVALRMSPPAEDGDNA